MPDPEPHDVMAAIEDGASYDGKRVLCSSDYSVCHCAQDGCEVAFHGALRHVDLALAGQTLSGFYAPDINEASAVSLLRVSGDAP